jgi:hypothetical protein
MKYKILENFRGSPDGCRVISYRAGEVWDAGIDFSEDLAEVALSEGWAEVLKEKKPAKKAKK